MSSAEFERAIPAIEGRAELRLRAHGHLDRQVHFVHGQYLILTCICLRRRLFRVTLEISRTVINLAYRAKSRVP
jgi:hypothetical protein